MAVKKLLKTRPQGIKVDKEMPVFQTHYRNHFRSFEHNSQPSKTVPNQSMKISEILRRFTKGLPITGERVPMYHGEEAIIDQSEFNKLDLSEQQEVLNNARARTQATLDALRRKNKKADDEKQEAIFREKFQTEMRKNEKPTSDVFNSEPES